LNTTHSSSASWFDQPDERLAISLKTTLLKLDGNKKTLSLVKETGFFVGFDSILT
jgi:hypothetical protein